METEIIFEGSNVKVRRIRIDGQIVYRVILGEKHLAFTLEQLLELCEALYTMPVRTLIGIKDRAL